MLRKISFKFHALFCWIIWNQNIHQSEESQVRGILGSSVTLPCVYDIEQHKLLTTCWGRGACPLLGCSQELFKVTGNNTIPLKLNPKYNLLGDLQKGNVSLTINHLKLEDKGQYCCRLEVPGLFNDIKNVFDLTVVPPVKSFACSSNYNSTKSTEECQSEAQSQQEATSAYCNIIKWTRIFKEKACNSSGAGMPVEALSNFTQHLLDDREQWQSLDRKKQQAAFGQFLQAMEAAVSEVAQNLLHDNQPRWSSDTLGVEVGRVERDRVKEGDVTTLRAHGNSVAAYSTSLIGDDKDALLAFMSYSELETTLDPMLAQEESKDLARLQFDSQVVTVTKVNVRSHDLNATINITFRGKEGDVAGGRRFCANWKGSHWSTRGCRAMGSNKTHIGCHCSSLSSFAVLLALHELKNPVHNSILKWITLLGLPISLLCLLLSMGTFFCCRSIWGLNTTVRAHLCLSLFLAELLFLIAMFISEQPVLCGIVAAALHYLFLAAFAWMFLEAMHLWLMVLNLKVANFSRTRVMNRRVMYPVGYVCPALIVGVSAAINPKGYGNHGRCWLDVERQFLWSFMGPVCFVVLVNTILFSMILCILRSNIASLNTDVSTIKESRTLTFKAMAQFILLGCSWVFGFFQLKEEAVVMSYLFTILNVAQGMFIFLIHCLLNSQVRREYHMWFNKMCRRKKTKVPDILSSGFVISQVMVTMDQPTQPDVQWMSTVD